MTSGGLGQVNRRLTEAERLDPLEERLGEHATAAAGLVLERLPGVGELLQVAPGVAGVNALRLHRLLGGDLLAIESRHRALEHGRVAVPAVASQGHVAFSLDPGQRKSIDRRRRRGDLTDHGSQRRGVQADALEQLADRPLVPLAAIALAVAPAEQP